MTTTFKNGSMTTQEKLDAIETLYQDQKIGKQTRDILIKFNT